MFAGAKGSLISNRDSFSAIASIKHTDRGIDSSLTTTTTTGRLQKDKVFWINQKPIFDATGTQCPRTRILKKVQR